MNWQRMERWAIWASVAVYAAATVALLVLLVRNLAPDGSPAQRLAEGFAANLSDFGDVGGGALFIIVLLSMSAMGGVWTMVLIFKGVDTLTEMIRERRGRDDRIREEGREEGREAGRQEGRQEGREEAIALFQESLEQAGISPDDLMRRLEERGGPGDRVREIVRAEANDEIRAIVREYLAELGISPDGNRRPPQDPTRPT